MRPGRVTHHTRLQGTLPSSWTLSQHLSLAVAPPSTLSVAPTHHLQSQLKPLILPAAPH